MRKVKWLSLASVPPWVIPVLAQQSAVAQDQAEASASGMADIVVTAQRRLQRLQNSRSLFRLSGRQELEQQ